MVLTGNGITAYGNGAYSPISGSVKYRVHRCAQGRCECCGAHEHQRALEVAPIIPRNQGGSDAIANLQALCFRCNADKPWPSLVSELHRQGLTQMAGISCHTYTASDWISSTRLIRSVSFPCWISCRADWTRSHCCSALKPASLRAITPGCTSMMAAKRMKSPTFTVTTI
ncbi:HNH endonuclease [Synechococcus sp. EJ6-Ellesmere]|nr:HNH endonuclease [Synechococcus sp. EJ6-Ellesmere]